MRSDVSENAEKRNPLRLRSGLRLTRLRGNGVMIRVLGRFVEIYTLRPTCSRVAFGKNPEINKYSGDFWKRVGPKRPRPKTLCRPLFRHGAPRAKKSLENHNLGPSASFS
jgi:hypothetical protein